MLAALYALPVRHLMNQDRPAYQAKKRFFGRMLTIFGRKPVLEALQDLRLRPYRLHLADSNKSAGIIEEMILLAGRRGAEVLYHDKQSLSRISKNAKQDQGVALDIECEGFADVEELLADCPSELDLMALDGITNPQNLGMIIRSVCASPMTGLLLPERGCARLDALVIKASAGTLFRARIYRCGDLAQTLSGFARLGAAVYGLDAGATQSLATLKTPQRTIFVMGNETNGLSPEVRAVCTEGLSIPMCNGVESLNVSVAASLLAFRRLFR
jgi:23S rRNA (guanosine2251-2'-O)-methyltransferase